MKQILLSKKWISAIIICIAIFSSSVVFAKIDENADSIVAGKKVYQRHCWPCHGEDGAGDGPAAEILEPRPRNFVSALFKLRTTSTGNLPIDEDMFNTVTNGMHGSAMPSFANLLNETERWQVVYYIKTFSEYFSDPDLNPYNKIVSIGAPPQSTPDRIKMGREVYEKGECFKCHGNEGRGNGESANELTDQEGYRILPRNLTKGWQYRGGTDVKNIYTRFTTGMDGTPMPSFIDNLTDEERWNLSIYVKSLIHERDLTGSIVKVFFVDGDLPLDPNDPVWDKVERLEISLAGQIVWKPRWLIPSVDQMYVKAIFNENDIAFKLVYDDRSKNVTHDVETLIPPTDTPYPVLASEDTDFKPHYLNNKFNLRDSVAIQFPVKPSDGTEKPHFMWGGSSNQVQLLKWNADYQEDTDKKRCVEELNGTGPKNLPKLQAEDSQTAQGKGVYDDGQWSVVIKKPLLSDDKNDVQFVRGRLIPVSFQAWDGSNSEDATRMSLSTWNYLMLEGKTPIGVYIYTGIFVAIAGILEWVFTWKARKNKKSQSFLNFNFNDEAS